MLKRSSTATAASLTTTTATAADNQNVSKSRLSHRQSSAARIGDEFVIYAAVGVGASCGIAEISITSTTVKRLELRAIPKVRCWRGVTFVIPDETLNRC
jgi:hypothetical protein